MANISRDGLQTVQDGEKPLKHFFSLTPDNYGGPDIIEMQQPVRRSHINLNNTGLEQS